MTMVYQNMAIESTPNRGLYSFGTHLLFTAHPHNCAISLIISVWKTKNLLCSGTQEVFVISLQKILVMLFFNNKFYRIFIRLFSVTKQRYNGACSKAGNPGNNERHEHAFDL